MKRQDPPPPPPDAPQPDPNNPQGQPPFDPNKPFAPPFNPGPPIVPADYTYSLNAGNGMISIIFVLSIFLHFCGINWQTGPEILKKPFFQINFSLYLNSMRRTSANIMWQFTIWIVFFFWNQTKICTKLKVASTK